MNGKKWRLLPWAAGLMLLLAANRWVGDVAAQPPVSDAEAIDDFDAEETADAAEDPGATIPNKSLMEIIKAGGPVMIPILFCSFILVVFVFERTIALWRSRVIPKPFVKRFMHQLGDGQLDRETALELCAQNKSAVAQVFAGALRKWGRPAVEVEQAVLDAGERAVNGLRRYVRVFNAVATISPLLGLLGTVFGMITAFNDISTSDAMGKPEMLAGGISAALITTAAGLTVAIPALVFYLYFVSRVDSLIVEIDVLGQNLANLISAEGLQSAPVSRPSRAARREPAA